MSLNGSIRESQIAFPPRGHRFLVGQVVQVFCRAESKQFTTACGLTHTDADGGRRFLEAREAAAMSAEIITIGSEFLLGLATDSDGPEAARALTAAGIGVSRCATVGDDYESLIDAIQRAMARCKIVLTIGGLGPTPDDRTREAVAAAVGRSLVPHPETERRIREVIRRRQLDTGNGALVQARIPEGAQVMPNNVGTAPGIYLETEVQVVASLPGPTNEFRPMLYQELLPRLERWAGGSRRFIVSRSLHVVGMPEVVIMDRVGEVLSRQDPRVASLPAGGLVTLRVTASAASAQDARRAIADTEREIRDRLGPAICGVDEETLEGSIIGELIARGQTVSTAESVTGGLVSHRLTNVPGSSKAFLGGAAGYTEGAKQRLIGVSADQIQAHGAVSEEVTRAMAEGIRRALESTYGVATTGLAGPSRDGSEYEVGTCFVAIADGGETVCRRLQFGGGRTDVKHRASQAALVALRARILGLDLGHLA